MAKINMCMFCIWSTAVLSVAGCHAQTESFMVMPTYSSPSSTATTPPTTATITEPVSVQKTPPTVLIPPGDMHPVVKPRPESRAIVLTTPPPPVMRPNPEPKILMDLQPGVTSPIIHRTPDNPNYMMPRPKPINAPYKPPRGGR